MPAYSIILMSHETSDAKAEAATLKNNLCDIQHQQHEGPTQQPEQEIAQLMLSCHFCYHTPLIVFALILRFDTGLHASIF